MKCSIRKASYDDIPGLCEIEKQSFSQPWSDEAFRDYFANGVSVCLVAECDGKVVAYVTANNISGECEIANIAVSKDYRRMGFARAILNELEAVTGAERILLDVRMSNEPAKKLYEAMGFTVDGIRKNFYQNPRENAVLMSKNITK